MSPASQRWVDETLAPLAPVTLCVVLVFLIAVPYRLPGLAGVMPQLTVMAVFYWSLSRPDLLSALAVVVVGLLQDVLTGGPLGMGALILLLVRAATISQRRFLVDKPFLVGWTGFAVIALGASLFGWVLAAAYYGAWPAPAVSIIQVLLTITAYPAVALFFGRLRTILFHA